MCVLPGKSRERERERQKKRAMCTAGALASNWVKRVVPPTANCGTDLCSGGNTQSENAAEWPPWSAVFF